ncbi:uroporphyrinogen decarboxylase family protein [Chloroflexota bacterium]
MATPQVKIGNMENAPDWYGTPLDKIHFEWSQEEELMLQRWCEKIAKNCEEEEMTPMERYHATFEMKPKDRLHIEVKYNVPYGVRSLDSWADAIKPGDCYKRPKLHIMAHLATAARFKLDIINIYVIHYTEECWGADGRMIDYGTPQMVGDPPIKTMEDIESVAVPDPKLHSLYPGYLWAAKEIKRIMKKYGIADKLPVELSFCGDPLGTVHLGMTGFGQGVVMMRKNQELFKACMEKAAAFQIAFGKACKECEPDGMYLCTYMGAFPPKVKDVDNTWITDIMAKVGREVKGHLGQDLPLWHTGGADGFDKWMPLYYEHGAMGTGSFDGMWFGDYLDHKEVFNYFRERDLYCAFSINDHAVLDADFATIEELLKLRCDEAKKHPKHACAIGVLDYWTPQPVFEKTMEMAKKLSKF